MKEPKTTLYKIDRGK